jgi:hypothetical protein
MRIMNSSKNRFAGRASSKSLAQQRSGDGHSEKRAAALRPAARRDCAAGRRTSRGLPRARGLNNGKLEGYRGRAPTAALRQPRMSFRMTIATALLPVQVVRARHANCHSLMPPCGAVPMRRMAKRTRQFSAMNVSEGIHV